jgi:hypothetical protein
MYPWWPEPSLFGKTDNYHSSTRLEDGRQGLLVDPGAWSNLVGENWVYDLIAKSQKVGLDSKHRKMTEPFVVQGVGTGTNDALSEVQLPIAISDINGRTMLNDYQAPTVGGRGKDLPALLGLESMTDHHAVLEMTEGHEYLTFPGPKGYTITWTEGTRRYKLERAPSGHLILPCDAFNLIPKSEIPTPVDSKST